MLSIVFLVREVAGGHEKKDHHNVPLRHTKVTLFMMIYLTVDELGNKHGIL